ncbi:hypothetical protein NQ317_010244 [Molorchus minor]|uniref:Uncharacterized protein n=1 Tax=Molorchus minor TaxID=1323400 RepID=A0ABQ9JHX0_9CUCU|nr:hypothetical protein NQ317_010244 [Molorchus minor]
MSKSLKKFKDNMPKPCWLEILENEFGQAYHDDTSTYFDHLEKSLDGVPPHCIVNYMIKRSCRMPLAVKQLLPNQDVNILKEL